MPRKPLYTRAEAYYGARRCAELLRQCRVELAKSGLFNLADRLQQLSIDLECTIQQTEKHNAT